MFETENGWGSAKYSGILHSKVGIKLEKPVHFQEMKAPGTFSKFCCLEIGN